jgi:hypothetical protein
MPKAILADAFGSGASQDINQLIIPKAAFAKLTAKAQNSTESLLVAILLQSAGKMLVGDRELDPDRTIAVEQGLESIVLRGNVQFVQNMFIVTVQKPKITDTIDPDDY